MQLARPGEFVETTLTPEEIASLPECSYWADGKHCYTTLTADDNALFNAREKTCFCGHVVKPRE